MPETKRNSASRVKRAAFALIPAIILLAIGTVVLRGLEGGGLIITEQPDERIVYAPLHLLEKRRGRWIFGGETMLHGEIPVKKREDTVRILLVGGSFVMGFPYTQGGMPTPGWLGIPHWLHLQLTMRFPDKRFEILNCAAPGFTSETARQVLEKMLAVQPDIVIVASGNNEGTLAPSKFNRVLHRWVLYRALKKTLLDAPPPTERELTMAQDPDVQAIAEQYHSNINRMAELCRNAGVPVVFLTLPINLRNEGFHEEEALLGGRKRTADAAIERGLALMREGKFDAAIEVFAESENQPIALQYMGKCAEVIGEFGKARAFYRQSCNLQPLGRARPQFNEFLRSLKAPGVGIIDLQGEIEARSPDGLPSPKLFVDYCHLIWWANAMMAETVGQRLIDDGLIEAAEPINPPPTLDAVVSQYDMAPQLDFGSTRELDPYIHSWESGKTLPTPEPITERERDLF